MDSKTFIAQIETINNRLATESIGDASSQAEAFNNSIKLYLDGLRNALTETLDKFLKPDQLESRLVQSSQPSTTAKPYDELPTSRTTVSTTLESSRPSIRDTPQIHDTPQMSVPFTISTHVKFAVPYQIQFQDHIGEVLISNACTSYSKTWSNWCSTLPLPDDTRLEFRIDDMSYINYSCVYPQILFGVSESRNYDAYKYIGSDTSSWTFGCTHPARSYNKSHRNLINGQNEQLCGIMHNGDFKKYGIPFREGSIVEVKLLASNSRKSLSFMVDGKQLEPAYYDLPCVLYLALGMVGSCKVRLLKCEKY